MSRLRYDLSEPGLRNFLIDEDRIGIACTKYRAAGANGWSFPSLKDAREAWEQRYGPTKWDAEVTEWGCEPKVSLLDVKLAKPKAEPPKEEPLRRRV